MYSPVRGSRVCGVLLMEFFDMTTSWDILEGFP